MPADPESSDDRGNQAEAKQSLLDTLIGPEDDHVMAADGIHGSRYYGHFGGLSVLQTVRSLCGPGSLDDDLAGISLAAAFDSSLLDLPARNHIAEFALLPPIEHLKETITTALDAALICKECLERDELWVPVEALYMRDPDDYDRADRSFLALVYALLALGRRHGQHDAGSGRMSFKGLTYFRASRSIIDIHGCEDLNGIMAVCCLASYLLSCSMISRAYECICTAVSAAMRLGLHVSDSTTGIMLSVTERTRRRRVFATLNIAAVVVSKFRRKTFFRIPAT